MNKNLIFSLLLHASLLLLTYFSFNFHKPLKITNQPNVKVSILTTNKEATKKKQPKKLEEFDKDKKPETPDEIIEIPEPEPIVKKPEKKIEKPKKKKKPKKAKKKKVKKKLPKAKPKQPKIDPTLAKKFSDKSLEKLGLLSRETLNIKNQITICYQKILRDENLKNIKKPVSAKIHLNNLGAIDFDKLTFFDSKTHKILQFNQKNIAINEDEHDPNFITSALVVKRALKFCNPLRHLPANKYQVWKEIDLKF